MDFELQDHHSILDILKALEKSRKKHFKVVCKDSITCLNSKKSLKIIQKAAQSLKKDITIITKDPKFYKELIRENIPCEYLQEKPKEIVQKDKKLELPLPHINFKKTKHKHLSIIIAIIIGVIILSLQFSFATIKLYPNQEGKTLSMKVIFCKDECEEEHSINYTPLEHNIKKTYEFISTGQEFSGTLSSGSVNFYNLSQEKWALRDNSRIQTEEGLIFIAQKKIEIPPAVYSEGKITPGITEIPVIAKENDAFGNIIGSNGNIKEGHFFLPGLEEKYRGIIWAEISKPFTGGTSASTSIVKQDDIDKFIEYVKQDIVKIAVENIEKELPTHYPDHIIDRNFTQYFPLSIGFDSLPKVDAQIKSLQINVDANIKIFLLSQKSISEELKTFIQSHLIEGTEELLSISLENLNLQSITKIEKTENFKADLTIPYFIKKTFIIDTTTRSLLSQKMGGQIQEIAKKIILERYPFVRIKISSWPPWRNSLPFDPGQIKIRIED